MTPAVQLKPQHHWPRAGLLFGLLAVVLVVLYFDTASAMVGIWWRSETFTHGFLVLPLALWMVWRRRTHLAHLQPQPSAWGLIALVLVGFGWLLGDLVAVNALTQLAFVAMLALLVPTLLGLTVARSLLFPLLFLFFAVPFGEFAMPQLMEWTADFTVMALRLSGIPVYREGLQFVIPSGNWSVVEACSGVRYLIASLTVGTLFAYLNYQSTKRRVLFIIVSILVPVLANWLRAYMIVMLGHLSGNKLAAGVDHIIYGWVFFGFVILLMFWIGARWSEPEPSVSAADIDSVTLNKPLPGDNAGTRPWFELFALLAAVILAWPLAARWALDHNNVTAPVQLSAPAELTANWVADTQTPPIFEPAFQNPSAYVNSSYVQEEQRVGLYLGYYRQQNYQRKLVSSENVLVTSKDTQWAQVAGNSRSIRFDSNQVNIREEELRKLSASASPTDERLVVWQVYWVNGQLTASQMQAKLYGALQRLLGRGDDSAVVILYADKGQGAEGAQRLQAFVQANGTRIIALLEATQRNHPTP
ncbi:exosortase A [Rhodoferax sp. U11-2br]|uniref:exosortase A n=1 Tax=Rhodoferax sp. U11-2br TaxID=2838878 RepID=UPI001BE93778|nr:exosortase A [Rhodoferax sp. U11-2br]MBT3067032.1 exosortase A [Rhodoferax sp. U11-2br]